MTEHWPTTGPPSGRCAAARGSTAACARTRSGSRGGPTPISFRELDTRDIGTYHWEANQEDFRVLSGEALLIIEGEERPLRQWDFVHCPAEPKHIIVGGGDATCVVLAVGAREHQAGASWGGYTVDDVALRHGAGVQQETTEADEAYVRFPDPESTRYGEC